MSEANTPENSAEEQVLKAFREDWEAGARRVIIHPEGIRRLEESLERSTAEEPTAKDWEGAVLRANFLRSLFLGSCGKFSPRSVTISCARIEGVLDLSYCGSRFPISFFWCIFPEGISLQAATIPELALTKCLIGQDDQLSQLYAPRMKVTTNVQLSGQFKSFREVNLVGANIGGRLICNGGHFKEGLKALHLETGEDVLLGEGFNSNGDVVLNGANIGRQLICTGGHFKKGLRAQNLKTGEDVHMREGFESHGEVSLLGADIGGQFACVGAHFEKGLEAQNLKTDTDVILSGVAKSNDKVALFRSNGKVALIGANIGGQLICTGSHFKEGLRAMNLKTGADVLLGCTFNSNGDVLMFNSNGEFDSFNLNDEVTLFKSNGKVDLSGADIGGQLDCTGGHFEGGLTAMHLKTGAGVFLQKGFVSNGKVNMNEADIGGQLSCRGGHLEEGLTALHLKVGADVLLDRRFNSNDDVDLSGADVGGQFSCTDGNFKKGKGLIADGLHYNEIGLGGSGNLEEGLAWLRKMRGGSLQPYEQLMAVYRRMGEPDWAREIGFELEKKRHEQSKGLWRAWYSILNCTIGYGYKPFRSLGWAVGLVTAGFLLFSSGHDGIVSRIAPPYLSAPAFLDDTILANKWIPSEGEAHEYWRKNNEQVPQGYPKFNPIIYSLEAAFPVLPLGQLGKWHLDNPFLRFVRWVWTVTGSALLAILALFGVGFLGPNRKSDSDSG